MEPIPRCDLETVVGKLPVEQVPVSLIESAAAALADGNRTRPPLSWRNRPTTSRYYGSLQRHLLAFWAGRDTDEKSGLPHLSHAAANLAILIEICDGNCHEADDDRPCTLRYDGLAEEGREKHRDVDPMRYPEIVQAVDARVHTVNEQEDAAYARMVVDKLVEILWPSDDSGSNKDKFRAQAWRVIRDVMDRKNP